LPSTERFAGARFCAGFFLIRESFMTYRWLRALLPGLILALFLGCQVQAGREQGQGMSAADSLELRRVPVETVTVGRGRIEAFVHLSAAVTSEAEVKVYSLVGGHVARLLVEEGRRVEAGDTLLVLEDAEILLAEARARLELAKARTDRERVEELARGDLVSEQDRDEARFAEERAELAWRSARLAVERSRVRAPIAGVVSRRSVQLGDLVSPSQPLFTLVDDRDLIAVLDVPEREWPRLRIGQSVRVESVALAGEDLVGRIKRIAPTIDPASGTLRVTVALGDASARLRSGMYARFSIVVDTREQALLVPKQALVFDREQPFAWVALDTTAQRRRVEPGYEDAERVEVRSGLDEGEALIVVGQSGLKQGSRIRVVRADGHDIAPPAPPPVPAGDETALEDAAR
jgi:membrane fusion protein, multidrug efflux system